MYNPYQAKLEKLEGQDTSVKLHRAQASDVEGRVVKVDEGGCTLKQASGHPGGAVKIFVAYADIRGIETLGWDLDTVS